MLSQRHSPAFKIRLSFLFVNIYSAAASVIQDGDSKISPNSRFKKLQFTNQWRHDDYVHQATVKSQCLVSYVRSPCGGRGNELQPRY